MTWKSTLSRMGYRITKARKAIIGVFKDHEVPWCAEEAWQRRSG